MPDEVALLTAIRAHPAEVLPKLAYADWLAENGDARAHLIRVREEIRTRPTNEATARKFLSAADDCFGDQNSKTWGPAYQLDELLGALASRLDEPAFRTFETDCAERVLGAFEAAHPTDCRLRDALRTCRLYLAGQASLVQLHETIGPVTDAMRGVDEPAWNAAAAVLSAADFGNSYGGNPASWHAIDAVVSTSGHERAADFERVWQIGRLVDILLYGTDYPLLESDLWRVEGQ